MNREELIKLLQSWLTTATDDNGNPIHVIMDVDIHEIATEIIKSSLPPAEGAEAIVKKYEDKYDFEFHWVQRDRVIRMMREFAAQPQPKLDPKKVQWSGYGPLGNISKKPLQPTAEGAEQLADLKQYMTNLLYYVADPANVPADQLDHWVEEMVNGIDEYFKSKQPTAEGAEEILESIVESLGEPINIHNHIFEIRPYTVKHKTEWWIFHKEVGSGEPLAQWLQNFATLHAQRIADKMVEERNNTNYDMKPIEVTMDYAIKKLKKLIRVQRTCPQGHGKMKKTSFGPYWCLNCQKYYE